MKLFIEVEVGSDEIPLATELFKILRLLTDHVKTRDLKKLFSPLVARLKDAAELDSVASEVNLVITELEASDLVLDEFISAFEDVVFCREMVMRQESVVPYMMLLPRLPDRARVKIKEVFIPKVLKHLTLKRPIDSSRMEFFAYAEAFASLVHLEFVPIAGAVASIITLLRKQDSRCAAVTMLGKTVELCLAQLTEKCDPKILIDLRMAAQNVTENQFLYDINYIEESMGWTQPATATATATRQQAFDEPATPTTVTAGLHGIDSYRGHRSTVFAMSYDNKRNQLISAGKDGVAIVWSSDGQVTDSINMSHHYACSMDIQSGSQTLLVCGVAKEDSMISVPPCIFRYGTAGAGWKEQGCLPRDNAKLISCIKVLGGFEPAFITGETTTGAAGTESKPFYEEKVCYYDMQASSFSSLRPLRQYLEHEDLITCISLFPTNPNIFMSASRDCTIRVWDRRADHSAGMFGSVRPSGRFQAHDAMVTCLDATDTNMIISASMDKFIHRWDYRTLSQGTTMPVSSVKLDDSAILKVALKPGTGIAAISTFRGLYLADFHKPRPLPRFAEQFPDARHIGRYHDLKWSAAKNILYAAGDDMRIDVYSLRA